MGEPFRVETSLKADDQIDEAYLFYSLENPENADRFLDAVQNALTRLSRFSAHQVRYDDIRLLHLNRYPYALHYLVEAKTKSILVVEVLHGKQNSKLR